MKKLYLCTHLGLGDQTICNALIRHYASLYDKMFLFIIDRNSISIPFMFRDLSNVKYISMKDDLTWIERIRFVESFKLFNPDADHKWIGWDYIDTHKDILFDKAFYQQCNIDFSERFSSFKMDRDLDREMALFKSLNLKEGEYIFISNNSSAGTFNANIDKNINDKNLTKIYLSPLTNNICDWIYTAENAAEIHSIDSGFKSLIDSFKLKNKLFFYLDRNNKVYTTSNNDWKVIS